MDLNKVKQPNESYSEFYSRTGLDVTLADIYKIKQIQIQKIKKLSIDPRQHNITDLRLRRKRRTELKKLMTKIEIPSHLVKTIFKYVGYDLEGEYTEKKIYPEWFITKYNK